MNAARQATRSAPRFAAQLRNTAQRRFASTTENEFIKERQHIKDHAQGTTGEDSTQAIGQLG
jgi:cytochrome c oxidase subunit 6a